MRRHWRLLDWTTVRKTVLNANESLHIIRRTTSLNKPHYFCRLTNVTTGSKRMLGRFDYYAYHCLIYFTLLWNQFAYTSNVFLCFVNWSLSLEYELGKKEGTEWCVLLSSIVKDLANVITDLTEIGTPFGETSPHRALKFFCKIPCPFL